MTELEIVDLASLEKAILHVSARFNAARPWWRGHAMQSWELRPRVFRPEAGTKGADRYNERSLLTHFKDRAATRHDNCPAPTDLLGWMFLAQHYGLPTRFLDWSASPLIGLYFAVSDDKHDAVAGHLCALSPGRLNHAMAGVNTERFSTHEPLVEQFALDAIGDTRKIYSDPLPKAITVCTREIDPRMMVQQAVFTLHSDDCELSQIEKAGNFLIRLTIPAAAKQNLRDRLAWLGLRPASIFPDLEHLASELRKAEFHVWPV